MTSRVLIIAGSDSGGGAGIQADIKTVTMLGGHAMTAITAITAQNTLGVQAVHPVPTDIVIAQIDSCLSDIGADAVKIGMIGSAATAHAVADRLERLDVPIVFDPVMVATSGSVLADAETIAAFERLMRIASVVTPNLPELTALCAHNSVRAELVEARVAGATLGAGPLRLPACGSRSGQASTGSGRTGGDWLAAAYGTTVLVKGGHSDGAEIVDALIGPEGEIARWSAARIDTTSTHGTGCTLASAIATGLGQGRSLPEAVERARAFVRASLLAAPGLGNGHGPLGQQHVTEFR